MFISLLTGRGLHTPLHNLEILSLKRCTKLTDENLSQFLNLTRAKLRGLDISSTNLIGEGTAQYIKTRDIKSLDISDCLYLTYSGLTELLGMCCHSLLDLNLKGSVVVPRLGGPLLNQGQYLPKLRSLHLNYSKMRGDVLNNLVRLCGPEMKLLDLSYTKISSIPEIERLYGVEELTLDGCSTLKDSGLWKSLCQSKLRTVYLSKNDYITGKTITNISLPAIQTFSITHCTQFADPGLCKLLVALGPLVTTLDLSRTGIREEVHEEIGSLVDKGGGA